MYVHIAVVRTGPLQCCALSVLKRTGQREQMFGRGVSRPWLRLRRPDSGLWLRSVLRVVVAIRGAYITYIHTYTHTHSHRRVRSVCTCDVDLRPSTLVTARRVLCCFGTRATAQETEFLDSKSVRAETAVYADTHREDTGRIDTGTCLAICSTKRAEMCVRVCSRAGQAVRCD